MIQNISRTSLGNVNGTGEKEFASVNDTYTIRIKQHITNCDYKNNPSPSTYEKSYYLYNKKSSKKINLQYSIKKKDSLIKETSIFDVLQKTILDVLPTSQQQVQDSPNVKKVQDNSKVKKVQDNSKVKKVQDNSTVKQVLDNPTIKQVLDNPTIKQVLDNPNVKQVLDNPNVKQVIPNVQQVLDNPNIKQVLDNSNVKQVLDNPNVQQVLNSKSIQDLVNNNSLQDELKNNILNLLDSNTTPKEDTKNSVLIKKTTEKLPSNKCLLESKLFFTKESKQYHLNKCVDDKLSKMKNKSYCLNYVNDILKVNNSSVCNQDDIDKLCTNITQEFTKKNAEQLCKLEMIGSSTYWKSKNTTKNS